MSDTENGIPGAPTSDAAAPSASEEGAGRAARRQDGVAPGDEPVARGERIERLLDVEVPVIAVLAERPMTLGQVISLRRDAVITFDKRHDAALEIFCNDHRLGSGKAIRIGDRLGIHVDEILSPEETLERLT